jgi:prepilin-type N-terminal cleavage/methylation domain-containing protein
MNEQRPGQGFSLIEVLLVVLVVGLLGGVVVSVTGYDEPRDPVEVVRECAADARRLQEATDAYFTGRTLRAIPAADTSADAFELTLVAAGLLAEPSSLYDLDTLGERVPADGSPCP